MGTFPRSLTTAPFERSSTGRFEACPCRPASGGRLPSSVQHHELTAQNDRGAVGRGWGPGGEQTSAGNLVVGRPREPGGKVLFSRRISGPISATICNAA